MTLLLDRRRLLAAGLAVTALPGLVRAATPPVQGFATEVAALLEPSSRQAERKRFWETRLSTAARNRWPWDAFDRDIAALATASGGVDLLSVEPGTTPGRFNLGLRTRRQGLVRYIRLRIDRDEPDRLFEVLAMPSPTPYPRADLPTGPMSRADLAAAIDRRLRFAADRDEFSGAVRVLAPDGAVVYEQAFGMADKAAGVANTPITRFHIGSADKSFTAIMAGWLIEAGRLSLDTRLVDILPDYPNREAAAAITVRHLLTHSSGLGGLFDRPAFDGKKPFRRMADLFPAFASEPLAFAPGSRAAYSNEGFVVLGAVIEQVTGESWYDLLARQVYQPAGMIRSGHPILGEPATGMAIGYQYGTDDALALAGRGRNDDRRGYRGNSCGGGYCTVGDMTAYIVALRAGRLLPPPMLQTMTQPAEGGLRDYGMGFQIRSVGDRRTIGHGGGGPFSGIDGDTRIVWETGWAWSILGNYDAPFAGEVSADIATLLAAQAA
jgi:CubicO group peptidase (beta-lactamase class C family)